MSHLRIAPPATAASAAALDPVAADEDEVTEINAGGGSPTPDRTDAAEPGHSPSPSSPADQKLRAVAQRISAPERDEDDGASSSASPPKSSGKLGLLTVRTSRLAMMRSSSSSSSPERRKSISSPDRKSKKSERLSVYKTSHEIDLKDTEPKVVTVHYDNSFQHTISWEKDIDESPDNDLDAMDDGLPEGGACNLYLFPTIKTVREPRGERPSMAGIRLLKRIILHLAGNSDIFKTPDAVGAFPIHALVVCNTPESLELSMELFERFPYLIPQVHVPTRDSLPLFVGESSLHICAVNRREKEFLRIVQLAQEKLDREEVKQMFLSQAAGLFFKSMPMMHYGGSALSYACCFELKQGVISMLESGHCSFNSRVDACNLSGFLPLHAIVANGLVSMYEYVTNELPHELRADEKQLTKLGTVMKQSLTSLQLSAKMGDHRMFRHILKRQCSVEWIWGPVTQFSLSLRGIDSAGAGGGDIMELITRMDAQRKTTEMLLDTFMNGFIYRLFKDKWFKRFGRKLHYTRRTLDLLMMMLQLVFSYLLKRDQMRTELHMWIAVAMLVVSLVIVEEELRTSYLFAMNEQGEGDARMSIRELVTLAHQFCQMHSVYLQFFGFAANGAGCLVILLAPDDFFAAPVEYGLLSGDGNATTASNLRSLAAKGGGASASSTDPASITIYDEGNWSYVWLLLTAAQMCLMAHFAVVSFMPFERLNVMLLSIIKMLKNDVAIYLVAFFWAILSFFASLFTLYPRSGENYFPLALKFNNPIAAIKALLELAFVGEPVALYIEPLLTEGYEFSFGMWLCIFGWVLLYMFLIIMFIILMLNLLIAMLTHTYDSVNEESTLQSRLSFSRCIVKLELVAESFGMLCHVGEFVPGTEADKEFVFKFRSIEYSGDDDGSEDGYPGDIDEGGADPFQDPAPTGIGKVQKGLESLQRVVVNQQKMLIASAKGDYSWVNDPAIIGELYNDDAPAIAPKPPTEAEADVVEQEL